MSINESTPLGAGGENIVGPDTRPLEWNGPLGRRLRGFSGSLRWVISGSQEGGADPHSVDRGAHALGRLAQFLDYWTGEASDGWPATEQTSSSGMDDTSPSQVDVKGIDHAKIEDCYKNAAERYSRIGGVACTKLLGVGSSLGFLREHSSEELVKAMKDYLETLGNTGSDTTIKSAALAQYTRLYAGMGGYSSRRREGQSGWLLASNTLTGQDSLSKKDAAKKKGNTSVEDGEAELMRQCALAEQRVNSRSWLDEKLDTAAEWLDELTWVKRTTVKVSAGVAAAAIGGVAGTAIGVSALGVAAAGGVSLAARSLKNMMFSTLRIRSNKSEIMSARKQEKRLSSLENRLSDIESQEDPALQAAMLVVGYLEQDILNQKRINKLQVAGSIVPILGAYAVASDVVGDVLSGLGERNNVVNSVNEVYSGARNIVRGVADRFTHRMPDLSGVWPFHQNASVVYDVPIRSLGEVQQMAGADQVAQSASLDHEPISASEYAMSLGTSNGTVLDVSSGGGLTHGFMKAGLTQDQAIDLYNTAILPNVDLDSLPSGFSVGDNPYGSLGGEQQILVANSNDRVILTPDMIAAAEQWFARNNLDFSNLLGVNGKFQ